MALDRMDLVSVSIAPRAKPIPSSCQPASAPHIRPPDGCVTVLRDARDFRGAPAITAKRHVRRTDGEIITYGYGKALTFRHDRVPVAGIEQLYELLRSLECDRYACMVRGRSLLADGERGVRRLHDRPPEPGRPHVAPTLERDHHLRVMSVDLDNVGAPAWFPTTPTPTDLERLALYARDECLPPAFAGVAAVWCWSGSAGIRGWGSIKGHLWVMLDRPADERALKRWVAPWPIDEAFYSAAQVHYVAAPLLEGIEDPLAGAPRTLLLPGRPVATLPAVVLTPAQQDEADAEERAQRARETAAAAAARAARRAAGAAEPAGDASPDGASLARLVASICKKVRDAGPVGAHAALYDAAYSLGGLRDLETATARTALLDSLAREPRADDVATVRDGLASGAERPWSPRPRPASTPRAADDPAPTPAQRRQPAGVPRPLGLRPQQGGWQLSEAIAIEVERRLAVGESEASVERYRVAGNRIATCAATFAAPHCATYATHPPEGIRTHVCESCRCAYCSYRRSHVIEHEILHGVEVALPLPLDAAEGAAPSAVLVQWPARCVALVIASRAGDPEGGSAELRRALRRLMRSALRSAGVPLAYRTVAAHDRIVVLLPDAEGVALQEIADACGDLRKLGRRVVMKTMARSRVARLVGQALRQDGERAEQLIQAGDFAGLATSAMFDPARRAGACTTASRSGRECFPWPVERKVRSRLVAEAAERRGGQRSDRCSTVMPDGTACGSPLRTTVIHATGEVIADYAAGVPPWKVRDHAFAAAAMLLQASPPT